ncbi:MAG: hypothetical protein P8Z75_15775, partial [Gammaproteobacteria bacterium]
MDKIIKRHITHNLKINPFPVIITIALTLLTSCATISSYQYKGLEFTVIDKNTGKPIQGVVAVATWDLVTSTMFSTRFAGLEKAYDAVSDKNGRIKLPAWGPVTTFSGSVPDYGPLVYLYKPGYKLLTSWGGKAYMYDRYIKHSVPVVGLGFPRVNMVPDPRKQN